MAGEIQYVKFGSKLYDVNQIIGKALIASVDLNTRTSPSTTAPIYRRFKKGENLGTVFSYIVKDGQLWWMFDYTASVYVTKNYYALHNSEVYSVAALKQQGSKTVEQVIKEKEEENKGIGDKIGGLFSDFGSSFKWVLIIAIIVAVLYFAFEAGLFKKFIKR